MVADFLAKICEYPEPYIHFAHNAQYDWRYILPYLAENEIPCEIQMRSETDIYEVRILTDRGEVIMRDSFAIYDFKLSDLAKSFCPEFPKLEMDFDKVEFDPDNPEHEKYARRDAFILAIALPRMNALYQKHFGVSLGPTIASTAMRAWQESLADDEIYECQSDNDAERFYRSAYYGGLVFLTRNDTILPAPGETVAARTFDVSSCYPSVMVDYGVPFGRTVSTRKWQTDKMGIYHVRVRSPENLIVPILPRRDERGYMAWSRGEFETVVTNRELIFAVNHGYEVLEVIKGVVWEETIFPFNAVIEKCKELRKRFKGEPDEFIAKKVQNSLYGKFGSRRERRQIFVPKDDEETIGAIPLDSCDYFWVKTDYSESMKCMPQWAVFITAHARLKLLQAIYAVGPEYVLYGDTDSITVIAGHEEGINIGEEYGQFKPEKDWVEFRALAPKVYAGRIITKEGIKYKGAAKGLPRKNLTDKHWAELLETGKTRAKALSLNSLRVAMRRGVREAVELERVSTDIRNSANWELHGIRVRPKIAA